MRWRQLWDDSRALFTTGNFCLQVSLPVKDRSALRLSLRRRKMCNLPMLLRTYRLVKGATSQDDEKEAARRNGMSQSCI